MFFNENMPLGTYKTRKKKKQNYECRIIPTIEKKKGASTHTSEDMSTYMEMVCVVERVGGWGMTQKKNTHIYMQTTLSQKVHTYTKNKMLPNVCV